MQSTSWAVKLPTTFVLNSPSHFGDVSMGWVMGGAHVTLPPNTPYGSDLPKWGIVRIHLVSAIHLLNFSLIATIDEKLIFDCLV